MTIVLRPVLAALIVGVAQAPQPNFAGRWIVDAPPAPAAGQRAGGAAARAGDVGSGWGSTITVAQTAATLTVEYAFFTRGDMQPPLRFTFALDGSETKNTVMMGRGFQVERSKAAWDGQALVITTLHDYRDPATGKPAVFQVRRTLTLESPDRLIVETTRAAETTRVVYRRAPAAG
jgi:hypothetical protein